MFTNLAILNRAPSRLFANSSYESWRSSPISQTDLTFCSSLKALTFWDTWQWQAFARHWDGSKSVKSWDTVHQNLNSHNKKCRKTLCLPFHNGIQASLLSTFNSPILWKKVSPLDLHPNRTAMFRMALKILWEKTQNSEKTSSVHMHEKVYPFW